MAATSENFIPAHLLQDASTPESAIHWTAGRLLAAGEPAYGGDACTEPADPGTVYALPRHRHVLDWRKACLGG